uniref:phosphatidylinositol N-acetylglucosaminyltransferase n=1 Tax=Mesocestoides corti TaxID=53468 RepID=A0A5K3FHZ3_MESCO
MSPDKISPRKQEKLTIALVCDCFHPSIGGVESHIYQLAQCLLLRGHRVIIITHAYGDNWQRQGVRYMARGLKVYYIPYRPFYNQVVFITIFGLLPVIRDIYIRENVDIVHGHSAFSPLALESLMHATALGLRTIFTDHSLFGFADLSSILANRALFMFLNVVDNFICVSNVAKENTVLRGGMEPERVYVIPNAIDSASFTPDPSSRDPDNITVVIVSRLVYRKGADLMAAIIPPLCSTFPNLRFIIGGDGPKRLALEEMRERHNLHFRVELLGPLPHHKVRDVLVRGDIFLNLSLTESFCIAIVEAASCGLLVVSTRVGGVPEVLPPHMIRLAPASASGLASTLANAIEEVRQQRLDWSRELAMVRSESVDSACDVAVHRKQSRERSVSFPLLPADEAKGYGAESILGCEQIPRASQAHWPPASAFRVAWQRHNDIHKFYTWTDVAKRTEKVYHAAMTRSPITCRQAMTAAYRKLGPVCGKIMGIAWAIEWLLIVILEWLRPANRIDRVPYFNTTAAQFKSWNSDSIPFGYSIVTDAQVSKRKPTAPANVAVGRTDLLTE